MIDIQRRTVLIGLASAPLLRNDLALAATAPTPPVVAIHMDQPFLDASGAGAAYRPPLNYGDHPAEAVASRPWL